MANTVEVRNFRYIVYLFWWISIKWSIKWALIEVSRTKLTFSYNIGLKNSISEVYCTFMTINQKLFDLESLFGIKLKVFLIFKVCAIKYFISKMQMLRKIGFLWNFIKKLTFSPKQVSTHVPKINFIIFLKYGRSFSVSNILSGKWGTLLRFRMGSHKENYVSVRNLNISI